MAGESVTVKGIGTFRPNGDALAGDSVLFIPDEELAAAVNAPFAMFEPVEVADGVNFDELAAPDADDDADAHAEADAVVAEAPAELPSEVPAEVPAEAEVVPEVREEPAEVEETPEAEEVPTVPPVAPVPEAPAEPAVKRYLFPEEEEGELPPAEPLRAPERKSNRMWMWILLIVLGGGIFGYLLALLDSDDDFETAPVEFVEEMSAADSLVAGKFISENALAAVGNSYEITLIFLAFAFGCNMGCSVIASQLFGAKEYGRLKNSRDHFLYFQRSSLCSPDAFRHSRVYASAALDPNPERSICRFQTVSGYLCMGLPCVFYNIATGIFSALGDSKTPFYFLAASSTSNIAVDILFVKAFHMGVAGVAWATFLCQGVSCILAVLAVWTG